MGCGAPPRSPGSASRDSRRRATSPVESTGGAGRWTRRRAGTDPRRSPARLMLVPLLLTAAVGVGVLRLRAARRAERAYAARRPVAADGVVPGAEGFTLEGTAGRGLLLLHGCGDTPQTLRYLGERLHTAGFNVHAPPLHGHGRGLRRFA